MKKKKGNFFVENYRKCWEFFKSCRWYFVFSFGVFALAFLIGFAFPVFFAGEIFDLIRSLVLEIEGKGTFGLIVFIFLNNLQASFFAFVLGIFLGIFPLVTCVVNGYLLGFVGNLAVREEGIFALWQILPHGIFELPAVLFSIGMGLKLGSQVLRVGSGKWEVGSIFREGLRFFVFVVLPLLVVAAVIEGILIGVFR